MVIRRQSLVTGSCLAATDEVWGEIGHDRYGYSIRNREHDPWNDAGQKHMPD